MTTCVNCGRIEAVDKRYCARISCQAMHRLVYKKACDSASNKLAQQLKREHTKSS